MSPVFRLAALGAVLASMLLAGPIGPGFDLLHTPDGTVNLDLGPLGTVAFKSNRIPGLSNIDTIVQRKDPGDFGPSGTDTARITIELVQLSLVSVSPVSLPGVGFFDVFVRLDPSQPSVGEMLVRHEDPNGGTFDSFFDVFTEITFGPQSFFRHDTQASQGSQWSHTAPPIYPVHRSYPSGGFYPVGVLVHTGPHPVTVPAESPEPGAIILMGSGALFLLGAKLYRG